MNIDEGDKLHFEEVLATLAGFKYGLVLGDSAQELSASRSTKHTRYGRFLGLEPHDTAPDLSSPFFGTLNHLKQLAKPSSTSS